MKAGQSSLFLFTVELALIERLDIMLKLPIINMLLKYIETNPLSFHVPGHRNGMLFENVTSLVDEGKLYLSALQTLMKLDVTELSMTDDLHDPQAAIKEAQQYAASLYGARHTFFLVGGSTAGNITAILATCEPMDYIIVQRNVHKSVINGCKLAGVNVVFISPDFDEQSGYSTVPKLETLLQAMKQYPMAKAVFLTNPNYYGVSEDLDTITKAVHNYNMLLIVDEAHGAHFSFHNKLPDSALSYGADIVIQSTHKTLPALTMSAMLHINTERINIADIQEQLAMIESSSPSFVMLAALDVARAVMESQGALLIEQSLRVRQKLISYLEENNHILQIAQYGNKSEIDRAEADGKKGSKNAKKCNDENKRKIYYDPLRLHVYDQTNRLTGYDIQHYFELHGIWAEMATSKHCILVLHIGYTDEEYIDLLARLDVILLQLRDKLNSIVYEQASMHKNRVSSYYNSSLVGEPILMTRALEKQTAIIDLEQAIGERSAEMLVPYPPGIPILYSGEKITADKIAEIQHYVAHSAKFQANDTIYQAKIKIIVNTPYN